MNVHGGKPKQLSIKVYISHLEDWDRFLFDIVFLSAAARLISLYNYCTRQLQNSRGRTE